MTNNFFNSDFRRHTFARGQFVRYKDTKLGSHHSASKHSVQDPESTKMGQVDQIFIHELTEPFIFIALVPVEVLDEKDEILDLHKVAFKTDQPILVGINAIQPAKVDIMDIDDNTSVWVDWQVEWL